MDDGQHHAALHKIEPYKQQLLFDLNNKFSGSQLVNNFTVQLEIAFTQYRDACRSLVLADLAGPSTSVILRDLWDMHTKVRGKFVQALSKLGPHAHQPPTKPYRDTGKEFVLFIKRSQAGYTKLLRAIHEKCPDVSVLGNIAGSYLSGETGNSSSGVNPGLKIGQTNRVYTVPDEKNAALGITRDSLIYIGDLSRWRHKAHVDRQSSTPQWKRSRLYYGLAHEVDPSSGLAKHQLAVLAQDDGKYFSALASLYQSVVSAYPHPQAINNLELLLTRRLAVPINQIISKVKPSHDQTNTVATLRAWFLQLHVNFYKGRPFEQRNEMESEVLSRLSQALKDGTNLDGTLLSMALITIAAEYIALDHAKQHIRPQENAQMYFFCFRHNVKTFKILLEHLVAGIETQARSSLSSPHARASTSDISAAALQAIRIYALWFSVNWTGMQKCIEQNTPGPEEAEEIRELWRLVAHSLNKIYGHFPLFEIKAITEFHQLVDEEESTMGFQPVQSDSTFDVWWQNGAMKPVLRRERSAGEIAEYSLVRIRDIYTRALSVAADESCHSLVIVGDRVIFNESGLFSPEPQSISHSEIVTPPPTAGGAIDPMIYPTVADREMSQDLPDRKRIPLKIRDHSDSPRVQPTFAIDPLYDLPPQLPWVPERDQDVIWLADHESVLNKAQWGTYAFAPSWYGTG